MNNLTFERVVLFVLAILVAIALVMSTIVTHSPAWEIIYITFVATLISAYALFWLLRGEDGHE